MSARHADMDRLIEPVILASHEIAVGTVFIQGAGYRVGTVSPEGLRHMSPSAARRLAESLDDGPCADALAPVRAALRGAADRTQMISEPVAGAA